MSSRYILRILFFIFYLILCSAVFAQEELKICALRVEFQPDENPLTTGNGQFVLADSQVTPYTIDPPPHNRSYFRDQIHAVNNYYLAASRKKLEISGIVYPLKDESVYILPKEMGYYNPNTTEEENNYRLSELFVQAITIADNDPDITFSNFDLITIFHAGVGKDIDLGFDDTPQDIPSIYFTPEFLKRSLGVDFDGVIVDNGAFRVNRAALLPETESQSDFELGLTGIFAANLGSHLGMYDLFSPSTQASGVGSFGLMDAGLFNMFGLSPSMPSAFSRVLVGWENPILLSNPRENISVSRLQGYNSENNTVYKIASTSNEYFLIEYRGEQQINIDSAFAALSEGREALPTYLEVLKTYIPDRIEISDSTGVLLKIDNYDWGLPGAGILIWHVDELVINQNREKNAINDDKENRAVDLEEADGSQDIGYAYTLVEPGYQSELGTWLDFWFSENPSPLYKNEFTKSTSPNTRTNRNYANSHIILKDFSNNLDSSMTFSYSRDYFEEGFPVTFNENHSEIDFDNPLYAIVDLEDKASLFIPDNKGQIFGITGNGKGVLFDQKLKLAQLQSKELNKLALIDSDSNQKGDILIATAESGTINALIFSDVDNDSLMDTLFTYTLQEKIVTAPVIQNPYFYVGTDQGHILRFNFQGRLDSTYSYQDSISNFTVVSPERIDVSFKSSEKPNFPPMIIDLDSDGIYEEVTISAKDQITIDYDEREQIIDLPYEIVAAPAFGDINEDGYYEIICNLSAVVYGVTFNGSVVSNMPFVPELLPGETLVGTPLIFDANGDDMVDIISNTSRGQIFAFTTKGTLVPEFPFSTGGSVSRSAVACEIDTDEYIELMVLNDRGDLFAWQLDASVKNNRLWWHQSSIDYTNNYFIPETLNPPDISSSDLLPVQGVYNYPNPNTENYTKIRYYLRENATVNIKIFDVAGDIVTSFSGPGYGTVANEIKWDLSDVSSGIYLCRVEAKSVSETQVRLIKIMVVK